MQKNFDLANNIEQEIDKTLDNFTKTIEAAVNIALNTVKADILQSYIDSLDNIKKELNRLQADSEKLNKIESEARWEASDIISREG